MKFWNWGGGGEDDDEGKEVQDCPRTPVQKDLIEVKPRQYAAWVIGDVVGGENGVVWEKAYTYRSMADSIINSVDLGMIVKSLTCRFSEAVELGYTHYTVVEWKNHEVRVLVGKVKEI
jgi:hypothetical protein